MPVSCLIGLFPSFTRPAVWWGGLFSAVFWPVLVQADPWADYVVHYAAGATADPNYTNPLWALGSPERFTGEVSPYGSYPSVVSMFSPPFGSDEIVSIGEGGELVVRFDDPIEDDPANPFGVDLLIFGNAGFADVDYPNGQIGSPPYLFGADPAIVEVSADGQTFFSIGTMADRTFPTQGYLDAGPYDSEPGMIPSNFLLPVNPALTLADFAGLSFAQAMALYNGSGGGRPIDIASTGLSSVSFVRMRVPDDGNPNTSRHAEIDALARVPEPASLVLVLAAGAALVARHRRVERRQ